MKTKHLPLLLAVAAWTTAFTPAAIPAVAQAKVRVAASTNDLASIAASVGGDLVEVVSIARSGSDPHRVEVLPSYMVRVSKAQVYLKVGLGLDQWADQIIDGSRNDKLVIVDCSQGIDALERPTGKVDASMGDVHPNGNPHYWLDPANGGVIARAVARALSKVDPANAEAFSASAELLAAQADTLLASGKARVGALLVKSLLTYHASWVYLAHAFELEVAATVEPVPGIPPTGKHLQSLVEIVKERGIRVLLQEPYFSSEAGGFLARETGVTPITMSPSCDDVAAGSWLAHIDGVLGAITRASTGS
jgi:ABC-type Zn uptake system ZnuABC Zn-binding protein ZnuA